MSPTQHRLTLDEFLHKHGGDNAELIDGTVVPLTSAGARCGWVGANTARAFGMFLEGRNLGVACCNDTFVLIRKEPPRVRGADFCFWAHSALPAGGLPEDIVEAPPELCVEMRSPTYNWPQIFEKVADYLSAGVKVVIVLDPFTKTASAYRPNAPPQTFTARDQLTLPDALPGFAVQVSRFFE